MDPDAAFEDAAVFVGGVPSDAGAARGGARDAPREIRRASRTQGTYSPTTGVDLGEVPIHDLGDVRVRGDDVDALRETVQSFFQKPCATGRLAVALGGTAAVSAGLVAALAERHPELVVVRLAPRLALAQAAPGAVLARIVGARRLVHVGARTGTRDEWRAAVDAGALVVPADDVLARGAHPAVHAIERAVRDAPVHVSLDLGVLDPVYAPGTSEPVPVGVAPWDVVTILRRLARRAVGLDVVELCPPHDDGRRTASLAARLARDFVADAWRTRHGGHAQLDP